MPSGASPTGPGRYNASLFPGMYPGGGGCGSNLNPSAVAGAAASGQNLSATASTLFAHTADAFVNNNNDSVTLPTFDFSLCDENDTFCEFNLSLSNSTDEMMPDTKYWTILLIIFPVFTVFGNILVVLSVVREKSLKTVTNYFICSLAVADIMVAVVVMPFAVYVEG
nr:hypothetical protein BaRGS_024114 [Batillaria attramentaria]